MRVTGLLFVAAIPGIAMGEPVNPVYQDGPQDPLFLGPDQWHELGDFFPFEELIESTWFFTNETSCFDGSDDPAIPNIMVEINNLSPIAWINLHYVADPLTTITNFDGWIGDSTVVPPLTEAFRIDRPGINQPLVFESLTPNEVFEPGETWVFIIQDYFNVFGAPPTPFDSFGIAGASQGFPPSSGSIIAQIIPNAGTLSLIALGGLAVHRRRR